MKKSAKFFIIGIVVGLIACSSIWLPMQEVQAQSLSNQVQLVKAIRKNTVNLNIGELTTVTVKCNPGETISGGGYKIMPRDIDITYSLPNIQGNEWQITGIYRGNGAPRFIEAYAVCLSLHFGLPIIPIKPTNP